MRCMRCACEVTLGWMEIVSHRVNPHTGETVTRLLCEACADEVAGRTGQAGQAAASRDAGANLERVGRDLARMLNRSGAGSGAGGDSGMTL